MTDRNDDLSGRVALVTGGASGLGRATCVDLAEHGAHVLVADIDAEGAKRPVALVEEAGGSAEPVPLDVTDRAVVDRGAGDRAVDAAFYQHGQAFDLLVGNAGTTAAPTWSTSTTTSGAGCSPSTCTARCTSPGRSP